MLTRKVLYIAAIASKHIYNYISYTAKIRIFAIVCEFRRRPAKNKDKKEGGSLVLLLA